MQADASVLRSMFPPPAQMFDPLPAHTPGHVWRYAYGAPLLLALDDDAWADGKVVENEPKSCRHRIDVGASRVETAVRMLYVFATPSVRSFSGGFGVLSEERRAFLQVVSAYVEFARAH